jgi:hypothetical protein
LSVAWPSSSSSASKSKIYVGTYRNMILWSYVYSHIMWTEVLKKLDSSTGVIVNQNLCSITSWKVY